EDHIVSGEWLTVAPDDILHKVERHLGEIIVETTIVLTRHFSDEVGNDGRIRGVVHQWFENQNRRQNILVACGFVRAEHGGGLPLDQVELPAGAAFLVLGALVGTIGHEFDFGDPVTAYSWSLVCRRGVLRTGGAGVGEKGDAGGADAEHGSALHKSTAVDLPGRKRGVQRSKWSLLVVHGNETSCRLREPGIRRIP